MGGFWSGLFGGSNSVLNQDIPQAGAISDFSTGVGEGDVTAASGFERNILNGGEAESEALAPEISAARTRAAQQKKTNAEFGTRSGGTAASNAAADEGVSGDILNLEGGLKSGAASTLAGIGTSEQGIGLNANQVQEQEAQQRQQNQENSIFGKAISSGVSAVESDLLGKALKGNFGGAGPPTSPPTTQPEQLTSLDMGAPPPDFSLADIEGLSPTDYSLFSGGNDDSN